MNYSFEGIGQWTATFGCHNDVAEGQMVKVSGNGEVTICGDGDNFCGMAAVVGRDGLACSVALSGMVTVPYSGSAPALGWSNLSADSNGGVKADESGRTCLVAGVDTANMTVTFVL